MRFWVIKAGEPIPFLAAERDDRVWRSGLMSLTLSERGHDVVFWGSQFDHMRKRFRDAESDRLIAPGDSGDPHLVLLSSPGYRRNIGVRRFWDHNRLAAQFRALAPRLERPDAILAGYPTVDLACAAVDFGRAHDVPVVLDVSDLWPDIIYDWLNRKIRRLGVRTNGLLFTYERMARRSFANADAVIAVSQGMLDWAITRFGQSPKRIETDRVFHQSKRFVKVEGKERRAEIDAWRERGVDFSVAKTRLVWAGTMTPNSDATALLAALEQVPDRQREAMQVIICGTGGLADRIAQMARDLEYVIYAGWVGHATLSVLLEESHIGLMCYLDRFDFQASVPTKVADYCAAGLRILTNLTGEIARLTKGTDVLIHYPTGDSGALARVLVEIAQDPGRYRVDYSPSREIFDRLFDADKVMQEFGSYLESLAARGSAFSRRSR